MASDVDAVQLMNATAIDRAILLLKRASAEPEQPISRRDVAVAIASAAGIGGTGGTILGATVVGGRNAPDPRVLRLVSEAWQILESARLVCRDLEQSSGDWWNLTGAGRQARDSSDPEGRDPTPLGRHAVARCLLPTQPRGPIRGPNLGQLRHTEN